MPRKPWNSGDRLRSHRLTVTAAVLSTIALAAVDCGYSSDSSRSSSSSSAGGGWSEDGEAGDFAWRSIVLSAQAALLDVADEPFRRPGVRFAIGPARYSFARIAREWGNSTSCKAAFRFDLGGMRELLVALQLPPVIRIWKNQRIQVRTTGEEVLCVLLRRLSYPSNYSDLSWEAGRHSLPQGSVLFLCAVCTSASLSTSAITT